MAEVAATIFTLAGVATSTLKVARTLRSLSRKVKYADKDIRWFACAIELFSNQITVANDTFSSHLSNPTRSRVFKFLDKRDVLGNLRGQAESVEERIETVKPKNNDS